MLSRNDLYGYQRHTVDFFKSHNNAAGWIDCGLGKTVSTLTAFKDLKDSYDANKMLVIAPKRVARKVWSDEVKEWSHLEGLSVSRIVGSEAQCFDALRQPADVYTIGRDRMAWLHAQFIQSGKQVVRWPFDIVVADESQSFASHDSGRFKYLADLREKTKFPRLIELSGTHADGAHPYLVDPGQTAVTRDILGPDKWVVSEQAVVVGETDDEQLRRAHLHLQIYSGLPNYRNSWIRQGFDESDFVPGGSERLARGIVGMNSLEQAAAAVTAHLDAGADHVVVQVLGDGNPAWDPRPALRELAEVLTPATA